MDAAQDALVLEVLDGAARGTRLALPADGSVVLGRSDEADLRLPDDGVSRRHAVVVVGADGAVVRDLGSTNGTLLNGGPLDGASPLLQGDVLQLAGVRVRCSWSEDEPDAASTSSLPTPRAEQASEQTAELSSPVRQAASVWRRVVAGVLTLGGLAGAVSGVRALWPDPDPQDRGTITSAAVAVDQPLSSFVPNPSIRPRADAAARPSTAPAAPRVVLVASSSDVTQLDLGPLEQPNPTAGPSVDEPTGRSSPTVDGPEPTASSEGGGEDEATQEPTASPDATGSPVQEVDPAEERRVVQLDAPSILELAPRRQEELLVEVIEDPALDPWLLPVLAPQDDPSVGAAGGGPRAVARSHPIYSALGEHGDQLEADEAARRLAERLQQVRNRPAGGKRDLLGAETTVDVELEGLRGTSLLLFWRLLPVGAEPVPADWSVATVAYRVTPATDRDVASLPVWVPLPETPGPFQLRLYLEHEEEDRILDAHLTEPFD